MGGEEDEEGEESEEQYYYTGAGTPIAQDSASIARLLKFPRYKGRYSYEEKRLGNRLRPFVCASKEAGPTPKACARDVYGPPF